MEGGREGVGVEMMFVCACVEGGGKGGSGVCG